MEYLKHKRLLAFITGMIFLCVLCFAAIAEEPGGAEKETADEQPDLFQELEHRLWGFFSAWTEEDMDRLLFLCSAEWKKEQEDAGQALQEILGTGTVYGYRFNDCSGKSGDPAVTVSVTLQRVTDSGENEYTRYEAVYLRDPNGGYAINPEGFRSGTPAEPVPEEKMTLLTPEEMIRTSIGLHENEELYDQLIPVNAAAEGQGIRMEVISGLVKGDTAWLLVSIQDKEGQYAAFSLDPVFHSTAGSMEERWWSRVSHNKKEHKDTYLICHEGMQENLPGSSMMTAGFDDIRITLSETVDLKPLADQYGGTAEGVQPPRLETYTYPGAPAVPEDVRILNWKQPLDIPLSGEVTLSGIGWIGNQLHIQFHSKGPESLKLKNGATGTWSAWVNGSVNGRLFDEKTYVDYSPLRWDENNDGWTEWTETIVNCSPEDAENLELSAEITLTEKVLTDDWTVQFPLNAICPEAD